MQLPRFHAGRVVLYFVQPLSLAQWEFLRTGRLSIHDENGVTILDCPIGEDLVHIGPPFSGFLLEERADCGHSIQDHAPNGCLSSDGCDCQWFQYAPGQTYEEAGEQWKRDRRDGGG